MLQQANFKNIEIENLVLEANSIYLLKVSHRETKDGSIEKNIKALQVNTVEKTDSIACIIAAIKVAMAEYKAANGIDSEFEHFPCTQIKTGISSKQILRPFLNTQVLWKTDSEGKLSKAIISEVPFNKTAMFINNRSGILQVAPKNMKAAIYCLAKGIIAQTSYISLIKNEYNAIESLLIAAEAEKAASIAKIEKDKAARAAKLEANKAAMAAKVEENKTKVKATKVADNAKSEENEATKTAKVKAA